MCFLGHAPEGGYSRLHALASLGARLNSLPGLPSFLGSCWSSELPLSPPFDCLGGLEHLVGGTELETSSCRSPVVPWDPKTWTCAFPRLPRGSLDRGQRRDKSLGQEAESQWIVAARLLCHLQYLVPYLSRLQRIHLPDRLELQCKAPEHGFFRRPGGALDTCFWERTRHSY